MKFLDSLSFCKYRSTRESFSQLGNFCFIKNVRRKCAVPGKEFKKMKLKYLEFNW
jgi:hypothetical protein